MKKFLKWTGIVLILLVAGIMIFGPTMRGPMLKQILGFTPDLPDNQTLVSKFKVPAGMQVNMFASDVPSARVMLITDTGDMIVSSTRGGTLTLLFADQNKDGTNDGRLTLLSDLDTPHGIALHDGWLYVSEMTQIRRFPYNAKSRKITGDPQNILTGLPAGGNHRSRTLGFGPDGRLYVSIGSSCNVCTEENPFRATITSMTALGKDVKIFATGLRNSVGFDWKKTGFGYGRLFATDNGRDLISDDTPNCELNIVREGLDYGWPYAYDNGVPDPDGGAGYQEKAAQSIHPYHGFGAHRAPLGIRFLSETNSPKGYNGTALVALHGSWNRSTLAGYKVVSLHFDDKGTVTQKDFMTGFLSNEDTVIGRPVEVIQGNDGIIYISDDYAGKIYGISWGENKPNKQMQKKETVPNVQQKKRANPLAGIEIPELKRAQQAGMLTFATNGCASCHIKSADNGSSYKRLSGLKGKYSIQSLMAFLKSPPSPMPPPIVNTAGRRDLAIYLLSIQEEKE